MGCSKQNVSYWALHSYSTQSKKSVYDVIHNASSLFELGKEAADKLAYSAGLYLGYEGGSLIGNLGYSGKIVELCEKAMISDRMLRLYNHKTPTKQTVMALAVTLDKSADELDELLKKYGYCLSDSIITDVVVKWYILHSYKNHCEKLLINDINEILDAMGLPLLMTKIN